MLNWPLDPALTHQPLWAEGHTFHQRVAPQRHGFRYPVVFWLLPMRARARRVDPAPAFDPWRALSGFWFRFKDTDHGAGGHDALAWAEDTFAEQGIAPNNYAELWLLCMPRVAGYAFKPVSFWFAVAHQGDLVAVLAEVNNTFGERHGYLIDNPVSHGEPPPPAVAKHFYVSPFFAVEGFYQFRFALDEQRLRIAIDLHDTTGPVLHTGINCSFEAFGAKPGWQRVLRHPFFSLGVITRIHLQAFHLWRKGIRLVTRPAPPVAFISK